MKWFVPLLPDTRGTALLRAMLLDGDAARGSWRAWKEASGDVKQALARDARPLLALLYDSVRRNSLEVDDDTATYLRSAQLTESLRSKAYGEVVNELTESMRGVSFLLIKGGAVGQLWYPDPALRHAHDIEIVVSSIHDVRQALAATNFRPAPDGFVHASGLPLRVHVRLPIVPHVPIRMANGIETLGAADALALALVHAARWISRASMHWVCDAAFIARNGTIEWPRFEESVRATRHKVAKQLAYLRTHELLPAAR